jgi:hypothetical protein
MKNAFVLSSLALTVAYPAAVAAQMIGNVSFHLPSFPMVMGAYAAVGALAFAFRDYSRSPASYIPNAAAPASPAKVRLALHALSLTNTTLHAS